MTSIGQAFFHRKTYGLRTLLGLLTLLAAIVLWTWSYLPEKDPQDYFHFADSRSLLGIQNAMDVLSNLAFLIFGLIGVKNVMKSRQDFSPIMFYCGILLSTSLILTFFGSSYFHWDPSPKTLVWDRLPMTIGFSAILAMVISDRIDDKIGFWVLLFLIPAGLFSVIGFDQDYFNLKPYIALQYGSIIFIILAVLILKERRVSEPSSKN